MKKLLMVIPLIFLLCFTFGCQRAEEVAEEVGVAPLSDEDVAAIKAKGPAIDKALLAGDWNGFMEMFTEHLLMMPPNLPEIKGLSNYKAWIESLGITITEANYVFNKIDGYRDIAYAQGPCIETFSLKDLEEPIKDEGKILTILRKQTDGS